MITAVRHWIALRAREASHAEPISLGVLWWPIVLVLLPIVLFLVLVGFVFELFGRIDRRHWLDQWTLWTLSAVAGLGLVGVVGWWVFFRR